MDLSTPTLPPTVALTRAFTTTAHHFDPRPLAAKQSLQLRQGFRIGDLALMVRYEDGSELTEMPRLFRMPNAPAWFVGVANLHGMLVPVFDLGAWAGVPRHRDARPMLLVLSHGADAAGVVIDGLPQRLRFSPDQEADAATAPARLAPHVRGAALIDNLLWFDIDRAALLDAFETSLDRTGN